MTLKNTDKFTVEVINRQTDNGETDVIRESGIGSLRIKDGKYFVMYKTDTVTVMIKLDGSYMSVTRTGESRSDMEYRLGKTTQFMYNTPYGAMEMELTTNGLSYSINEAGGEIHLCYTLCGIENNMSISIVGKR